jgi:hypothetical protein
MDELLAVDPVTLCILLKVLEAYYKESFTACHIQDKGSEKVGYNNQGSSTASSGITRHSYLLQQVFLGAKSSCKPACSLASATGSSISLEAVGEADRRVIVSITLSTYGLARHPACANDGTNCVGAPSGSAVVQGCCLGFASVSLGQAHQGRGLSVTSWCGCGSPACDGVLDPQARAVYRQLNTRSWDAEL